MPYDPRYDALLRDVCVGMGWCGGDVDGKPSHVGDFIPASGPVSAEQFADWLMMADGVDVRRDPARWQPEKDAIVAAFVRRMGGEAVDAALLRWSD